MKKLQAESAARHGVLVESLSGIETVRANGAESRMQTLWERSVAATARTGEDVHFWGSLALSLAVAFVVTVPVNRWLISRGRGHAVVHQHHS